MSLPARCDTAPPFSLTMVSSCVLVFLYGLSDSDKTQNCKPSKTRDLSPSNATGAASSPAMTISRFTRLGFLLFLSSTVIAFSLDSSSTLFLSSWNSSTLSAESQLRSSRSLRNRGKRSVMPRAKLSDGPTLAALTDTTTESLGRIHMSGRSSCLASPPPSSMYSDGGFFASHSIHLPSVWCLISA